MVAIGVKPLKTKWVFRLTEAEIRRQVRCKARLALKRFLQRPGIDFEDTIELFTIYRVLCPHK